LINETDLLGTSLRTYHTHPPNYRIPILTPHGRWTTSTEANSYRIGMRVTL